MKCLKLREWLILMCPLVVEHDIPIYETQIKRFEETEVWNNQ